MKVFMVLALACGLIASEAHAEDFSIAQQLVAADNALGSAGELEVQRAQIALDSVRSFCAGGLSEEVVANVALAASKYLLNKGIYARPIDVLEDLDTVYNDSPQPVDCPKVIDMYLKWRQPGINHVRTASAMRAVTIVGRNLRAGKK